jgi:hypothetical protein
MHASLFSSLRPRSSQNLQSWDRYKEMEQTANKQLAVTDTGDLLEYETLVSRLLPPNIKIDNDTYEVGLLATIQRVCIVSQPDCCCACNLASAAHAELQLLHRHCCFIVWYQHGS